MPAPDVDEADDLYALDPAEFTAARNALAKRLRAEGRRDDAAAVAGLRRPNLPAWALNRVARERPELVERALAAGAALRAATEAALAGDASGLRAATAEDREAADAAVDVAAAHLGARSATYRPALAATLRAAVLDDEVAHRLRRGVLTSDHEAPAFGFAAGLDLGAPAAPARSSKGQAGAPRQRTDAATATSRAASRAAAERAGARQPADEPAADGRAAARQRPAKRAATEQRAAEERAAAEQRAQEERRRRRELESQLTLLDKRVARTAARAAEAEAAARAARAEADEAARALAAVHRELAELDERSTR